MFAPLQAPVFRRIWSASLLSNLGLMIGGVSAAWAMTQLTTSVTLVALVQTAAMLPVMLIALPAGAIADMYDRRKVAMIALCIAIAGATGLGLLSAVDRVTPNALLLCIFIIGVGTALFSPAWQASVAQQVPPASLPAAIALNSVSFNIARSFGPAVGGVIVATLGSTAAFAANALFCLPLVLVLFLWRREIEPSRLPPERLGRAMVSGLRYVANSPSIRILLARLFVLVALGGSLTALMPMVTRTLLDGDAQLYGMLLGCFGLGAVTGAVNIGSIRSRFGNAGAVTICSVTLGIASILVGLSRTPFLTAPALFLAGASWMICMTTTNIGVQVSSPRWVAARALATFQMAMAGAVALGSWIWGHVAESYGVGPALIASGVAALCTTLLGRWLPIPSGEGLQTASRGRIQDPEVNLALTGRSGPIVIHLQYRVDPANARAFYRAMQDVQLSRQRTGAYGWSISRDITDPELWTERFHCPTWHDFLRLRDRPTQDDMAIQERATAFHIGPEPVRISRMLERPFGSVRWKDEVPDRAEDLSPLASSASSG